MTSEARKSQMPILPLFRPVSRRTATVYGMSICYQASNCGVKSLSDPGTLYSYGPRYACGAVAKLPCGGGDGADHSIVVACHTLPSAFSPFQMLQKKLKMNGIWKSPMIHAPQDETAFQCMVPWAKSYAEPASNKRRDTPASPTMNIGMKTTFMQTSEPAQWILPSVSFIFRPEDER